MSLPPPHRPPPPQGPPPGWVPPPGWTYPPPPQAFAPPPRRELPALEGHDRRVVRTELAVIGFAAAAPGLVFGLKGLNNPASVDTDIDVLTLVGGLLAAFGPAVVCVYLLWRDRQLEKSGFGRRSPGFAIGWGAVGLACCAGAVMIAAVVAGIFLMIFGAEPSAGDPPDVSFTFGSMAAALLISLTAGFTEETVYRGYGISRMEQAGLPRAALVVPWLVWTAQHLYAGPIAVLIVGAVGVPLVWLFWWKRSIWPVIVAHVLYDIVIFLINALDVIQ